jgi:hypothetical protein
VEDTGRFMHSIIPSVTLKPWFADWKVVRKIVTTVSRIISGQCGVRTHLKWFQIEKDGMCVWVSECGVIVRVFWKCLQLLFSAN